MGFLSNHLDKECDARLAGELSYAVKEAYRYLDELINNNPVMQSPEMVKTYGHLRQGFVDLALQTVLSSSSMKVDVQIVPAKNNGRNGYTYALIEAKGAIISPVKTSSKNAIPRRALHRSVASVKNKQLDLFTTQEDINELYDSTNPPFILLTYGGTGRRLEFIQLGLPDVEVEQWIEKVDIFNSQRIITSIRQEETIRKNLDLSLTARSKELIRRESDGTTNIQSF